MPPAARRQPGAILTGGDVLFRPGACPVHSSQTMPAIGDVDVRFRNAQPLAEYVFIGPPGASVL